MQSNVQKPFLMAKNIHEVQSDDELLDAARHWEYDHHVMGTSNAKPASDPTAVADDNKVAR